MDTDISLNWIYLAISWVLLRWHDLWSLVLGPASGWGWVLSIVSLVVTIRILLFPVFVKQIKSQRKMQELQPKIKALQGKHKGDKEALQKEMMELYRQENANPLMGCLPLFAQIPVFIGLFHVLRLINPLDSGALRAMTTEYGWTEGQFVAAAEAKIFGVPIAAAFRDTAERLTQLDASSGTAVKMLAGALIATMVLTTYITQRQLMARNKRTGQMADQQQQMIQRIMLYGVPASLLISGGIFPIGVVIYWVTTNLFSMGQQFWVIKNMPDPAAMKKAAAEAARAAADEGRVSVPRPGAKPVNPKKAPRASGAPTAQAEGVNLGKGQPVRTKNAADAADAAVAEGPDAAPDAPADGDASGGGGRTGKTTSAAATAKAAGKPDENTSSRNGSAHESSGATQPKAGQAAKAGQSAKPSQQRKKPAATVAKGRPRPAGSRKGKRR